MTLNMAVTAFAMRHQHYSTPEGARDKCTLASLEFGAYVSALADRKDWEVVDGMFVDPDNVVIWAHSALRVGQLVYDWTARQFYPPAPFPVVLPYADWCEMLVPLGFGEEVPEVVE